MLLKLSIETNDPAELASLLQRLAGTTALAAALSDEDPGPFPDEDGIPAHPVFSAGQPAAPAPQAQPAASPADEETPAKRTRRTKAKIEAEKAAAAAAAAAASAAQPQPQPAAPVEQQAPAPAAQPVFAQPQPTPAQPAPQPAAQPVAASEGAKSPLPQIADAEVTLDVLKQEMAAALNRVPAATAQAALKGAPGGAASLSTAEPANYVAIYHALRAL